MMKSFDINFLRVFFKEEELQPVQHLLPITKENAEDILASTLFDNYRDASSLETHLLFEDDAAYILNWKVDKLDETELMLTTWNKHQEESFAPPLMFLAVMLDDKGRVGEFTSDQEPTMACIHNDFPEGGYSTFVYEGKEKEPVTRLYYDKFDRLVTRATGGSSWSYEYADDIGFVASEVLVYRSNREIVTRTPFTPNEETYKLRSSPSSESVVYWDEDPLLKEFFENGVTIGDPKLNHLVKELDRRLVQLWDKVQYEAKVPVVDMPVVDALLLSVFIGENEIKSLSHLLPVTEQTCKEITKILNKDIDINDIEANVRAVELTKTRLSIAGWTLQSHTKECTVFEGRDFEGVDPFPRIEINNDKDGKPLSITLNDEVAPISLRSANYL